MNKVKCLIYCTKNGENLLHFGCGTGEYRCVTNKNQKDVFENEKFNPNDITRILNGKIVAQFDCEKVDLIEAVKRENDKPFYISNGNVNHHWGFGDTCLSYEQLNLYLENKKGYAILISNLEIFDEPKELNDFKLFNPNYCLYTNIKKAPQNMCYVVKEPEMCFAPREEYILISIRPEWVAKILNGEKTIEVRKSIVNKLKELI